MIAVLEAPEQAHVIRATRILRAPFVLGRANYAPVLIGQELRL